MPIDLKRFKIKDYDQLNIGFNSFYIDYINSKFEYEPKWAETGFISLGNTDLTKTLCIKEERTILNKNMFSYNNHYYIPIDKEETEYVFL